MHMCISGICVGAGRASAAAGGARAGLGTPISAALSPRDREIQSADESSDPAKHLGRDDCTPARQADSHGIRRLTRQHAATRAEAAQTATAQPS